MTKFLGKKCAAFLGRRISMSERFSTLVRVGDLKICEKFNLKIALYQLPNWVNWIWKTIEKLRCEKVSRLANSFKRERREREIYINGKVTEKLQAGWWLTFKVLLETCFTWQTSHEIINEDKVNCWMTWLILMKSITYNGTFKSFFHFIVEREL